MTLQVVFRTDASVTLGTGHVMRCLELAARLTARGARCSFICRSLPGDLTALIEAAGHTVWRLAATEGHGGVSAALDDAAESLATLGAAASHPGIDWLVADHYRLEARWERAMREATGARLLAIDGRADRPHDVDILLDPVGLEGSEGRWDALLPAHCQRLIGPAHALLRAEFGEAAASNAPRDVDPPRLLLCFGGTDAPNATQRVLSALCGKLPPQTEIDVVVGAGNPNLPSLTAFLADHPGVTLHRQPPALARLMRAAQVGLCAGGGTLLELCALQVPALVVTIADNQRGPAQTFAAAGCAVDLGPLDSLDAATLLGQTAALLSDPGRQRRMRAAQAGLMSAPAQDLVSMMWAGRRSAHAPRAIATATPEEKATA